ncbi:hypothetical protein [uncultured Microbacterium sp.]|jgi:hypothetical protein|uniref:hypothetical protein n=1 Tax=Microbacterium algeriense TaxID=2615184 RepID=UPI002594BF3C|nr:hypothetical protein [uncultured Microbacterium sp.]
MKIALQEVSKGRNGQALPLTSLEFHTGSVRFALAETEQRPTVLGLIASGRMRPDSGRVSIDGSTDTKALRRRVALVDAPDVSDPHPDIALAGVVGEELMFAGVGATPLHARRWLAQLGYAELASVPIGSIDPAARVRILCELAILREGVDGVVLVSPDRHGGSPDGWWRIAGEFADRGYAMLVIVGGSAAVALERMHEFDAVNASGPVEPLALEPLRQAQGPTEDWVAEPAEAPEPTEDWVAEPAEAPEPTALRQAQGPTETAEPENWVAEPVEAPGPTDTGGAEPVEAPRTDENGEAR